MAIDCGAAGADCILNRMSTELEPQLPAHFHQVRGPVTAYLAFSILLFPWYRYLISPDGISYVSIAKHYLARDWADAVNLYWSPLYSWLLAIPISAGSGGVMAMRMVAIAAGLGTLFAFALLARKFVPDTRVNSMCLWIAALLIFAFTLQDSPDLLMAAFLLLYFGSIFDGRYAEQRWTGLWCGIFGGLTFLTKSYGFFFFAVSFPVLNALHWWRAEAPRRRAVARHFILGWAAFAVLAGPWIAVLSHKAGRVTVGTTGEFNFRLVGPQSQGYPSYTRLFDPPNEHAISFWEAPNPQSLPAWTPLSSSGARHEAKLCWTNFKQLLVDCQEASLLSIGFLLAYAIWGMSGQSVRIPSMFVLLTLLIYPAGYILLTLQDRYLWPVILLLVLIGGVVVDAVNSAQWASRAARNTLTAAFAISFLLFPVRLAWAERNAGRQIYEISSTIAARFSVRGNLAACGNWNNSLYVAYYLNCPFLGDTNLTQEEAGTALALNPDLSQTPAGLADQVAEAEVADHRAAYYLAWNNCASSVPAGVLSQEDVTHGQLAGLKIYRLR